MAVVCTGESVTHIMVRRVERDIDLPTPAVTTTVEGNKLLGASTRRPSITIGVDKFFGLDIENQEPISYEVNIGRFGDINNRVFDQPVAEMSIEFFKGTDGTSVDLAERMHLYHLQTPQDLRGMGMGSILTEVFKQYAMRSDISEVSLRVGNGSTEEFLINRGFNEEYVNTTRFVDKAEDSVVVTEPDTIERLRMTEGFHETGKFIEGIEKTELFR